MEQRRRTSWDSSDTSASAVTVFGHEDCHGITAATALSPPNFFFDSTLLWKETLGEVVRSLTKPATIEHYSTEAIMAPQLINLQTID